MRLATVPDGSPPQYAEVPDCQSTVQLQPIRIILIVFRLESFRRDPLFLVHKRKLNNYRAEDWWIPRERQKTKSFKLSKDISCNQIRQIEMIVLVVCVNACVLA